MTYIPPPPPEDEDSIFAHYQTGINFDKYDTILVEVSGHDPPPAILVSAIIVSVMTVRQTLLFKNLAHFFTLILKNTKISSLEFNVLGWKFRIISNIYIRINCCVEREGTIFPPHLLKLGWKLDLNLLKRILFLKIQYFCFLRM